MTGMASILLILFNSAAIDIVELRKLYYKASDSRKSAAEFFDVMKRLKNDSNPLLIGFTGMAYMIQAKYSYNPYTKLTSFNKGRYLLDKAVASSPGNLELRFLRFGVQTNAPEFLGYNAQIQSDKAMLLKGWKKITDPDLKVRIKNYMLQSNYCNDNERSVFK